MRVHYPPPPRARRTRWWQRKHQRRHLHQRLDARGAGVAAGGGAEAGGRRGSGVRGVGSGGAANVEPDEGAVVALVAGGVAANKKIRSMLINLCEENNYKSIFPPIEFCGDNAAMIAMVGLEKFKINQFNNLDYPAKPRWPLDEDAAFLKGAGVQL